MERKDMQLFCILYDIICMIVIICNDIICNDIIL